jgi:hypothetical protein
LWSIRDGGLNASGEEIIVIDYPSGSSWEFSKPSAGASYLTALSRTQDRVEKIGTSPDRYSLWHADGSRMQFVKQAINNETHYLPEGEYDKYGLFYAYTLDTKNRVTRHRPCGALHPDELRGGGQFHDGLCAVQLQRCQCYIR